MKAGRARVWLVEEFGRGGIARYCVDVANLLDENTVVATTSDGPAPGLRAPRTSQVWFPTRRVGKPGAAARGALALVTRSSRGDVVWLQIGIRPLFEWAFVRMARRRGLRTVVTLHNRNPRHVPDSSASTLRVARGAERVVVHTQHMLGWARRHGLEAELLPFPVPDIWHSGPAGRIDRGSLGLAETDVVFLMFGNMKPYKGVDVVLEALERLARAGSQVRFALVLAGSPAPATLPSRSDARRVVVVDRFLEDGELVDLLGLADVGLFPYRWADHSGAAVLTAATGLRAIATDIPCLREAFGESAVYVPPGWAGGLATAMEEMARMGRPAVTPGARAAPPTDPTGYRRLVNESFGT